MLIILPIIIFAFLFIITHYFYQKLAVETHLMIRPLSIYQTFFTFFIMLPFYLKGYLVSTILAKVFLIIVLLLAALIFGYLAIRHNDEEGHFNDVKLEVLKNTLIVFSLTVLPFLVFMTILRFNNPFIQILLSLLAASVIYGLSTLSQKYVLPIFSKLSFHIGLLGTSKWFILWLSIVVISLTAVTVRIPLNTLENSLNLSHHIKISTDDKEEIYYQNNFTQEEIFSVESNLIVPSITSERDPVDFGYSYTSTTLFVRTRNLVTSIDRQTNEIILQGNLEDGTISLDDPYQYGNGIQLTDYDILLNNYGSFVLEGNELINSTDEISFNSEVFFYNDEPYFLNLIDQNTKMFMVYKIGDEIEGIEEISSDKKLKFDHFITNNNLILKDDTILKPYNEDLEFPFISGKKSYYDDNQVMYYIQSYAGVIARNMTKTSTFYKVDGEGNSEEITLNFDHNRVALILDGDVYLYDKTETRSNQIEIMNGEFRINTLFNHVDPQSFFKSNDVNGSFVIDYRKVDDHIEFLQLDFDGTLTVYKLVENDTAINLPIYTSYSIGIFAWIILAIFIPTTEHSINYVTIGFIEKTRE